MADSKTTGPRGDDAILTEAKKRFKACVEWESQARKRFLDDLRFDAADADNRWQWPNAIWDNRENRQAPSLTINKIHVHNLQIINDGKQNKPGVKIRPTGGEATYRSAQIYEGVIRRIEYLSNAQVAYDTAYSFAVRGGIGYWRVVADYLDDDSFDQDLFIQRIKDPLSVYIDPDINEPDGSDARFGFIFQDLPKDEVEDEFPEAADELTTAPLDNSDGWITEDHVRVAEYYRKKTSFETLVVFPQPELLPDGTPNPNSGQIVTAMEKDLLPEFKEALLKDKATRKRQIARYRIEWFKIVGSKIVERRVKEDSLPIPYIPIVRMIGEEYVIEGKLDRKGHTRSMKDPQRMLNYWVSGAAEQVALQGKTPWTGPAQAIAGFETYWNTANTANHAYMPFNHVDDNGEPIPAPSRVQPPQMAQAYIQGMQMAEANLMGVSGQHESQFGEPSNERSGKAINERQRQGDNATYHFIDNLGNAISFTGKILIAWIPHVYDTRRILRILAEDGTEQSITVDPSSADAIKEHKEQDTVSEIIFNPSIGKYDVQADVGPGYATKRQEAFNAVSQIAAQNMELMTVVGDILFKNADFPGADELAERLRRMVPKNILGEGPDPEVAQMQEEMQNLQSLMAQLIEDLSKKDLEIDKLKSERNIDAYKAETQRGVDSFKAITDRMKVLGVPPEGVIEIAKQLLMQALETDLPPEGEIEAIPGSEAVVVPDQVYDPMTGMPGA